MEKAVTRLIQKKYPELASGWHLPMWGKVTDILTPLAGEQVTEEAPIYAVTVQLLDANGVDDAQMPLLEEVLLPVPAGGEQRGFWSKPSVGSLVEVAFMYGSPAHPFIRSVFPHGLTLPNMAETDQKWQQSEQAYMQVNQADEWEVKGKNKQLTIEENLKEQIGKVREVIAAQHHVGDDSTNIYALLHDLMNTVADLANVASSHSHSYSWSDPGGAGTTSPPMQSASYSQASTQASEQASQLAPLLK